jgi:carbamoyltransferase
MTVVLGISAFNHDSSVGFIQDGRLVYGSEEERFRRIKHTPLFPADAIADGLRHLDLEMKDVGHAAFFWNVNEGLPVRAWQTLRWAPGSMSNLPTLVRRWLASRSPELQLRREFGFTGKWYRINHYLSHAASVFFVSPFEEAAILVVDGAGEIATTWVGVGRGNRVEKKYETYFPHSLGFLWCAVTEYLGFHHNSDEGTVMALGVMGANRFLPAFRKMIVCREGRILLDMSYFDFHKRRRNWYGGKLEAAFGPARRPGGDLEQHHLDVATALQLRTTEIVTDLAAEALRRTAQTRLCYTGGVALNCVTNGTLSGIPGLSDLYINPPALDSGAGIGAGLYVAHHVLDMPRRSVMDRADFGPDYDENAIRGALEKAELKPEKPENLCDAVARVLAEEKIVGWFQGRMEIGPRALGHRSILASPMRAGMKDVLNNNVKHRESFRPFGPSVPVENAGEFFDVAGRSLPFMLQTVPVLPRALTLVPAALHVDGTARIQTVSRESDPLFHRLLERFGEITGVPVLVNTSFNRAGEPIVCTPADAVACFQETRIDALAIGPFLVRK